MINMADLHEQIDCLDHDGARALMVSFFILLELGQAVLAVPMSKAEVS